MSRVLIHVTQHYPLYLLGVVYSELSIGSCLLGVVRGKRGHVVFAVDARSIQSILFRGFYLVFSIQGFLFSACSLGRESQEKRCQLPSFSRSMMYAGAVMQ